MTANTNVQSVNDFCRTFGISRSMFYKLGREGRGPRLMKVGRRTLISGESAQEWQKRMENPA